MAEVYTISGSAFGAAAVRSAPMRLQNALKALGQLRGDPALTKIKVDGVIGPATVKGVNYAIAQRYVVMKDFPRPELTLQHVRQFSAGLAAAVEGAVKAGGGSFPLISSAPAHAKAPVLPPDVLAPDTGAGTKWVWWAVGGVSVLVVLAIAASAVRKRRREPAEA
jgi:LPXTG-motif cell wall-anchored protein